MDIEALIHKYINQDELVVLLEGTRQLPDIDRPFLTALATKLTREFPNAIFRTGNATGSDDAFALGVANVDVSRLEYVLPFHNMGKSRVKKGAKIYSYSDLNLLEVQKNSTLSKKANPDRISLFNNGLKAGNGLIYEKAAFLFRDTLKVTGCRRLNMLPATIGIFYVKRDQPFSGGTGHTMKVCINNSVEYYIQQTWKEWLK